MESRLTSALWINTLKLCNESLRAALNRPDCSLLCQQLCSDQGSTLCLLLPAHITSNVWVLILAGRWCWGGKSMSGCVARSTSTSRCSAEVPELLENHLELEAGLPRWNIFVSGPLGCRMLCHSFLDQTKLLRPLLCCVDVNPFVFALHHCWVSHAPELPKICFQEMCRFSWLVLFVFPFLQFRLQLPPTGALEPLEL